MSKKRSLLGSVDGGGDKSSNPPSSKKLKKQRKSISKDGGTGKTTVKKKVKLTVPVPQWAQPGQLFHFQFNGKKFGAKCPATIPESGKISCMVTIEEKVEDSAAPTNV